jgi:hypothetical protein
MKSILKAMMAFFLSAITLTAADGDIKRNKNSLGLGYSGLWGPSVSFHNNSSRSSLLPLSAGGRRDYVDGYVDTTGSANSQTRKFGYDYQDQIVSHGCGQAIEYHNYRSEVSDFSGENDPSHGIELLYEREVSMIGTCPVGFEIGFGYSRVDVSGTHRGNVFQTTDTYTGPDPWFNRAPFDSAKNRDTVPLYATPTRREAAYTQGEATASRSLEANIFGLRLGPSIKWPIAKHLELGVSGGFAAAFIDSEFAYSDSIVAGPNNRHKITSHGSTHDLNVAYGGYFGAKIIIPISERLFVSLGYLYRHLTDVDQSVNGRNAELDLGTMHSLLIMGGFTF